MQMWRTDSANNGVSLLSDLLFCETFIIFGLPNEPGLSCYADYEY